MTIAARVIQTIVRLVAVAAFFFTGRNGTWAADQPSKLTPVRVAVVSRSTLDMPFFIARDKGLFREEGLEVELIFMKAIQASGALGTLSHVMIRSLYRSPTILMIFVMTFVMFPGMLTGLSSVCILTTGALVAPALLAFGMPRKALASFLAIGGVLGMIAPPINIPVMIIGGGVDMPYVGFEKPLLLATGPLACATALYYRVRYRNSFKPDQLLGNLPEPRSRVFEVTRSGDQLVIRQSAQARNRQADQNTEIRYEVRYFLKPYQPGDYPAKETTPIYDRHVRFFEIQPQLELTSGRVTRRVSRFDIREPVTFCYRRTPRRITRRR